MAILPRGGRGLSGNRFLFLLVLIGIGAFLYYHDQPQPWTRLKNDVLSVFGIKPTPPPRPKPDAERPGNEDVASDATNDEGTAGSDSENESEALERYLPAYGRSAQLVRHTAFTLQYEEEYEQARWVVHRVLNRSGKAKRADHFSPDPLVKTGSALPNDYARTGYDRGHLAPAGDFKYSQKITNESFYMSNMSPQAHALNIGIWNEIEAKVRTWAKKYGPLVVVTGPVLKPGLTSIGRSTRVAVPAHYFKIVYDPKRGKAIAFLVENRAYPDEQMRDLTVSIDEVERVSGVDFFAGLPDSTEQAFETQYQPGDWF